MVTVVQWSWEDVERAVENLTYSLKARNIKPHFIVALARGGLVPASLLEDTLGLVSDMYSIPVTHYKKGITEKGGRVVIGDLPGSRTVMEFSDSMSGKDVLVVDDLIDSGDTMLTMLSLFEKARSVTVAVLTIKKPFDYDGKGRVQIFSGVGSNPKDWIIFPWERNEFKEMLKNA